MKKLIALGLLAFTSICLGDSTTSRMGLTLPTIGSPTWGQKINGDMQIIDAGVALIGVPLPSALIIGTGTASNMNVVTSSPTPAISFLGTDFHALSDGNTTFISLVNPGGSGGGGISSLAVGTGTASAFTTQVTSPTAVLDFEGAQFRSVALGSTNYLSLNQSSVTVQGNYLKVDPSNGFSYNPNASNNFNYSNVLAVWKTDVVGVAPGTLGSGRSQMEFTDAIGTSPYYVNFPSTNYGLGLGQFTFPDNGSQYGVLQNSDGNGTGVWVTSLGPNVLVSSFPKTAVTPGSYTNTNLTVNAQGMITAASSGTAGGGGASTLAVGTGTATNFVINVTSPTGALNFDGTQFRSAAIGSTNYITMTGNFTSTVTFTQIGSATIAGSNSIVVFSTTTGHYENYPAITDAAQLGSSQTFTGTNTFSNTSNIFYGDGSHLSGVSTSGGSTIYNATGTPGFPFGFSASSANFTGTAATQFTNVSSFTVSSGVYINFGSLLIGTTLQYSSGTITNLVVTNINGSAYPPAGGEASTLAVGTGTASNFVVNKTSPTAAISFNGLQFNSSAIGTTNYVTLASSITVATMSATAISASNGVFSGQVLIATTAASSSPGLAFNGASTVGMYYDPSNLNLGIKVGGNTIAYFSGTGSSIVFTPVNPLELDAYLSSSTITLLQKEDSNFRFNNLIRYANYKNSLALYESAYDGIRYSSGTGDVTPFYGIYSGNSGSVLNNLGPVSELVSVNVSSFSASAGNIGISSTTPAYKLAVNGNALFTSSVTANSLYSTALNLTSVSSFTVSSSVYVSFGNLYQSSKTLSAVSFPSTGQYGDLVSTSIFAGTWEINFIGCQQLNGATISAGAYIGISTVTGNSSSTLSEGDNLIQLPLAAATGDACGTIAGYVITVNATTTIYGKFEDVFSVATPKMVGRISATRIY